MSDSLKNNLVKEAWRIEEDTRYSSKGHYAAADGWRSLHLYIGVPTATFTGLAGLVIVGGPAEIRGFSVYLVFGMIAILGAVSTAVMTFLGPEKRSSAHQDAGNRYNALKSRARRFREIDVYRSFTYEELAQRLEALAETRDELESVEPLDTKESLQEGSERRSSRAIHLRG